tara:strand:- start:870 stop:1454 length:585 start_codon:yes stop_codon:yes gene_type:complete
MDDSIESVDDADKLVPSKFDEALVRFVAQQLIRGKSEKEVKRALVEHSLFDSRASPSKWRTLIRQAQLVADDIRYMVVAKAEMDDIEHQRIDSYARRRRAIARLEAVIVSAHDQADSVSKLNSVSFMLGGLIKAQESMDKFTGAQEAAPQVVVNVGYDPLQQFREVIQEEIQVIDIEAEPADADSDEQVDSDTD